MIIEVDAIVASVARQHGVTPNDIKSRRRSADKARREAMWLARKETGLTYQQLGAAFGCHHTTVMGNYRLVETGSRQAAREPAPFPAPRDAFSNQKKPKPGLGEPGSDLTAVFNSQPLYRG